MNYFISLQKSQNQISYLFNKNHFLILLLSLVIIVFFSMYLTRQKTKTQKIAVLIVGSLLVVIESLRIFWNYKFLQFNNLDANFFSITNLDFFTLSLWISLPLIFIGAIVKKKDKHNIFILNFVFSIAMLFGIISLIYPININTNYEFYHCYNIMYILLRSLVIMLGLTFAFAKWITIENLLDLWKSIFSLVLLFAICYVLVLFLKPVENVFYMSFFPVFEDLGIHLNFPWHLLLMFAFLFIFQIIIHLPFYIRKNYKLKHGIY